MRAGPPAPTFLKVMKYGLTMMAGGLLSAVIATCALAAFLPKWVRATFDMSEWNLPLMTATYFMWFALAGLPFMVTGGWALLRTAFWIRGKSRNTEQRHATDG